MNELNLGSGIVALNSCDTSVNVKLNQAFQGSYFTLDSVVVDHINGAIGTSLGCASNYVVLHFNVSGVAKTCTALLPATITGDNNQVIFDKTNCSPILANIKMNDLDEHIGLEFMKQGGA